jgi:hypothetical protein
VGAYDAMQEVRCVYRMYIPDLFWKFLTRGREHRSLRSGHGLMKDYGEAGLYRVREKIHIASLWPGGIRSAPRDNVRSMEDACNL